MGSVTATDALLILLTVAVVWAAYAFNRLVALRARCDNGWSQIDVQLRRRHDLIPNLVETVKGYAAHERELFERVTLARTRGVDARSVGDQATAEREIGAGLRQLFAVAEAYPQLKADASFLALQEELSGTESKIAYARQFYNDQVMRLNTRIQSFPSTIIARAFGFTAREFFEIDDDARGPVAVSFGEGS